MKADVSYNDFVGTAAADISDHTDLKEFLTEQGVDVARYEPIGVTFYAGYEDFFSVGFLCRDAEKSTAEKPHVVQLGLDNDLSKKEFFALFKRFSVVVTLKHSDYGQKDRQYAAESVSFENVKGTTKTALKHRNNNDQRE